MIEFLRGILVSSEPVSVVLEVGGIGYILSIPFSTYETLPPTGETVTLITHHHVREDSEQLYGFSSEGERRIFRQLLTISGIGAKMAIGILSGTSPAQLQQRVATGDVAALTRIPGIGKKTAERIVVELRDVFATERVDIAEDSASATKIESLLALQALGYGRQAAEKALSTAVSSMNDVEKLTSGTLIKQALKLLNS